ncbi:AAA family ATPase [Frigidibacter sp. MR17.14]|uniref:AAA family ATPase n=1 Tax=Frigidibacter sp. MR17.14 TaxID=3126509 RepID=UPI003012E4C9
MTARYPFVLARYPDPTVSEFSIRNRLREAWCRAHIRREGLEPPLRPDGTRDQQAYLSLLDEVSVTGAALSRVNRRAKRYMACYERRHEVSQLPSKIAEVIEPARHGVRLIQLPSEARADEIAAELHADYPGLGPCNEFVWHAMRQSWRSGEPGLRLPPVLLVGAPGIGKSHWARRLATLIGVPSTEIDAAGENASFSVAGCQRGWGNAGPGRPVELVLREQVGNVLIVVDEIEKAVPARGTSGGTYNLTDGMLPFLEPATSARWSCPYVRLPMDMSWINWVMTANGLQGLSAPFLSRCRIIELPPPSIDQLAAFTRRAGRKRGLSDDMIELSIEAMTRCFGQERRPNLRTALRLLDNAVMMAARPLLH